MNEPNCASTSKHGTVLSISGILVLLLLDIFDMEIYSLLQPPGPKPFGNCDILSMAMGFFQWQGTPPKPPQSVLSLTEGTTDLLEII